MIDALTPRTAGEFLFGPSGAAGVVLPEQVRVAVDGTARTIRRLPSLGRTTIAHEV